MDVESSWFEKIVYKCVPCPRVRFCRSQMSVEKGLGGCHFTSGPLDGTVGPRKLLPWAWRAQSFQAERLLPGSLEENAQNFLLFFFLSYSYRSLFSKGTNCSLREIKWKDSEGAGFSQWNCWKCLRMWNNQASRPGGCGVGLGWGGVALGAPSSSQGPGLPGGTCVRSWGMPD